MASLAPGLPTVYPEHIFGLVESLKINEQIKNQLIDKKTAYINQTVMNLESVPVNVRFKSSAFGPLEHVKMSFLLRFSSFLRSTM